MSSILPDIPRVTLSDNRPENRNTVQHWGFFSEKDLRENAHALLMLDIDFGRRCSLRCPTCFRKHNPVDNGADRDLRYHELIGAIDEARTIGLREVKICGAGEPLEDGLLLRLAMDLTERDIGLAVFTKAHVLGDDELVRRVFGAYGVKSGQDLCERFFALKTSFLVSFQSPRAELQDRLVGGIPGYTEKRNRGLVNLADAGFNKSSPTRLALCSNPIVRESIDDLFSLYVYARERNILPVNAALMVSGKLVNADLLLAMDASPEEKENLFVRIYEYNLTSGIQTPAQLAREGISCLPGVHPCNQIAAGLYLTLNGNVIRCPGDTHHPLGNVRRTSLVEIWSKSWDWPYAKTYNCHCPFKDGITLPRGIYERVAARVLSAATVVTEQIPVGV